MPLKVRSVNGTTFWRCGIQFGAEPTLVDDKKLSERLGPPSYSAKAGRQPTVRDVLEAESALVCEPATAEKRGSGREAGRNGAED